MPVNEWLKFILIMVCLLLLSRVPVSGSRMIQFQPQLRKPVTCDQFGFWTLAPARPSHSQLAPVIAYAASHDTRRSRPGYALTLPLQLLVSWPTALLHAAAIQIKIVERLNR
ncbi:hypothetical protein B0H16DRAFT_265690 [Mycena metata]|uniref:Secreted protein n=1 Tax=Mycena metata TaxID=1033252 RepID=A0AAD7MPM1_9AGAR|nr:hypothetical protein B0H16DRAFT_265690 [Mycena metata]